METTYPFLIRDTRSYLTKAPSAEKADDQGVELIRKLNTKDPIKGGLWLVSHDQTTPQEGMYEIIVSWVRNSTTEEVEKNSGMTG